MLIVEKVVFYSSSGDIGIFKKGTAVKSPGRNSSRLSAREMPDEHGDKNDPEFADIVNDNDISFDIEEPQFESTSDLEDGEGTSPHPGTKLSSSYVTTMRDEGNSRATERKKNAPEKLSNIMRTFFQEPKVLVPTGSYLRMSLLLPGRKVRKSFTPLTKNYLLTTPVLQYNKSTPYLIQELLRELPMRPKVGATTPASWWPLQDRLPMLRAIDAVFNFPLTHSMEGDVSVEESSENEFGNDVTLGNLVIPVMPLTDRKTAIFKKILSKLKSDTTETSLL